MLYLRNLAIANYTNKVLFINYVRTISIWENLHYDDSCGKNYFLTVHTLQVGEILRATVFEYMQPPCLWTERNFFLNSVALLFFFFGHAAWSVGS